MQVKCITNDMRAIKPKLRKFAFGQNERGLVDLTEGNEYQVYGLRKNNKGSFYLVLTDSVHDKLPWWMPAAFFEQPLSGGVPTTWLIKSRRLIGKDTIQAPHSYFGAEEDIEDGTERGYKAFDLMRKEASEA